MVITSKSCECLSNLLPSSLRAKLERSCDYQPSSRYKVGYKALSIVLTGVQEDAVLSNFAGTVLVFVLVNCMVKGIKTPMKVSFRSEATLVYPAWVSSKGWMFFQQYPSVQRIVS